MASNGISISAGNQGPLLNICNWIFLVITCIACSLKVISKWIMIHKVQVDDAYMTAAMLGTVGFGVSLSYEVSAGLGKSIGRSKQGSRFDQAAFATQIFYILSLCFGKLAILQFLLNFALRRSRRFAVYGFIMFNVVWVVIGILSIAFQCKLPHSWAVTSKRCFNQREFWEYTGVTDAILDLATAILPVYLLYDLQMGWSRKLPVIIVFTSRALLIPIIAIRLIFIDKAGDPSGQFVDNFNIAILTVLHVNLNVIVTCLPFIKPITDSLQTGVLASDIHRDTATDKTSYPLKLLGNSSKVTSRSGRMPFTGGKTAKPMVQAQSGHSQERMIIQRDVDIDVTLGD